MCVDVVLVRFSINLQKLVPLQQLSELTLGFSAVPKSALPKVLIWKPTDKLTTGRDLSLN